MVSLASNNAGQTGGFFGFSDDRPIINSESSRSDDDLIVDHIDLVSGQEVGYRPIKTTCVIWFTKILYVALGVAAYVLPVYCSSKKCGESPESLIFYIHGGMWFILLVIDEILSRKHDESRLQGYLEFYRKTKRIRHLPVTINSCANALMVVLVKVLDSCCKPECGFLTKMRYIQILVSLECVVALVVLVVYFVQTYKFNRRKALPDVSQGELMSSFDQYRSDVGFRGETERDQVMEKQADMIRYLRQHMEKLARRNLDLTTEISRMKGMRREGSVNGHF